MHNRTSRLLDAFNRLDKILRERISMPLGQGDFLTALENFQEIYGLGMGDFRFAKKMANFRNAILHEYEHPIRDLAIPREETVQRLEAIVRRLDSPERLEQRFAQGNVTVVSPEQTLDQVLGLVQEKAYSQFPVIDAGRITGLLTENGITRWLASAVGQESLVEFADISVATILQHEEPRENMRLLSRIALLDDVRYIFRESQELEAVVVTQSGEANEAPLGIVTRADL